MDFAASREINPCCLLCSIRAARRDQDSRDPDRDKPCISLAHGQHKLSSTVAPCETRDQCFVPMSWFPHATVAECHGLKAYTTDIHVSHSGGGMSRAGVPADSQIRCLVHTSSCFVVCLHAVSSHGRESDPVSPLTRVQTPLGPTLMTPANTDQLLKAPSPHCFTLEVRVPTCECGGHGHWRHSVICCGLPPRSFSCAQAQVEGMSPDEVIPASRAILWRGHTQTIVCGIVSRQLGMGA